MNINKRSTLAWIIAITIAIFVVFGLTAIIKNLASRSYTAAVNVNVAPSVAKITFNGRRGSNGNNKVKPGTYTVTASYAGFSTVSKQVTVSQGKTATVDFILTSNSPSTATWYQDHPADQTTAEVIAGHDFNTKAAQLSKSQPLINLLPFIGPGFEYRIDYGAQAPNASNTVIYIQTDTAQGKQDALNWIESQGYTPANLNIQYVHKSAGPSGPTGPAAPSPTQ